MEIRQEPRQTVLAVRQTTPVTDLPAVIDEAYRTIMQYAGEHRITFTGAPVIIYRNADMQALEVEMGFPVADSIVASAPLEVVEIPGGRALVEEHIGPYAAIEPAYTRVMQHVEQQQLAVTPWMYERYLNSPEDTPADQLITEIIYPLQED